MPSPRGEFKDAKECVEERRRVWRARCRREVPERLGLRLREWWRCLCRGDCRSFSSGRGNRVTDAFGGVGVGDRAVLSGGSDESA